MEEYSRATYTYNIRIANYNKDLFEYYQKLLQTLQLVGNELAANGIQGLTKQYPWLAGDYNCTGARGGVAGPDGESQLYVPGETKRPFPVHWVRLARAMAYSQKQYGDFEDWWLVDASSFNLHGFVIIPSEWLFLSTEQFFGNEFDALADMIHEPLHDRLQFRWGHTSGIKEIVPCDVDPFSDDDNPTSKYGSDWEQLYWFLFTTKTQDGMTLWNRILDWIGPRPVKPSPP